MNTNEKIKMVAIDHFGKYGYRGASLSRIAEDVGIKKPSLYAHFSSKQSLFEACMDSAMSRFIEDSKAQLGKEDKTAEQVLYDYPASFINVYAEDDPRLFYLRFAYMPPEELGESKIRYSNEFIEALAEMVEKPVRRLLSEMGGDQDVHKEALAAYLCMFDGLMVELLFGGSKEYSRKLESVWAFYLRGVK